jgi:tetratricopeptide (TPR) repeat protein
VDAPEIEAAKAWLLVAAGRFSEAIAVIRPVIAKNPDLDGGYYLLLRALFSDGRYQEVLDIMEPALAHAGENYITVVPIGNALGALGKKEAYQNFRHRSMAIFEAHLRKAPDDARARVLIADDYAAMGRLDDAKREADLAMMLCPDDAMILYNVACLFCGMGKNDEAVDAIRKAFEKGYRDGGWARRDPDLAPLLGHPEFDRIFPEAQ